MSYLFTVNLPFCTYYDKTCRDCRRFSAYNVADHETLVQSGRWVIYWSSNMTPSQTSTEDDTWEWRHANAALRYLLIKWFFNSTNQSPYCLSIERMSFSFRLPQSRILPSPFLRATAAAIAILSVRPSVCPSVCPSHRWISPKRCKLGSPNLHRRLPGRL